MRGFFLIRLTILIVMFFSVTNLVSADKKIILVVQSYHSGNAWDDSYKSGLEESLGKMYKLEYFEMDTKRIPANEHPERAELAWEKYKALKPALIILGDDAALKFLGPKLALEPIPVVYLGINNNPRNYFETKIPLNFTGVLERPLLLRSIVNLKDILPSIKNVLVLFDDNITSEIVKKEIFSNKDKLEVSEINVDFKMISDYKIWQNEVLSAKGKYDICIAGLYQTIKNNDMKPVDAEEIINWTSKNAVVPTFAFWDFAVGTNKTIGGTVIFGKDMGKEAADFVINILEKGKSPKELKPIFSDHGQFLFSKSQMAKWNIVLPANIESKTTYVE